eukprot:6721304-Pyramimonas_sp.AAC.2
MSKQNPTRLRTATTSRVTPPVPENISRNVVVRGMPSTTSKSAAAAAVSMGAVSSGSRRSLGMPLSINMRDVTMAQYFAVLNSGANRASSGRPAPANATRVNANQPPAEAMSRKTQSTLLCPISPGAPTTNGT